MPVDVYAHETPRWSIRLERETDEEDTEQHLIEETLAAIRVLAADWLQPLALHLSIGCYDTETYHAPSDCEPPQPQWFLRQNDLSPCVKADYIYADPVIEMAPELTDDRIRAWVAHAMAQECSNAPRFIPSWRELYWPAVRIRLPDPSYAAGSETLQIGCYAGTISVPLERRDGDLWLSAPRKDYGVGSPVGLTARNYDGVVAIGLDICWTLWIDALAGREEIEAAISRVLGLGRGSVAKIGDGRKATG